MKNRLEIIKTNNDIISTSGFDHKTVYHYYMETTSSSTLYEYQYDSENDKWIQTYNNLYVENDDFLVPPTEDEKYYILDTKTGKYVLCEEEHKCLASGTKVIMADGSLKNIEDIKKGDNVLSFNHELGKCVNESVYLVYKGKDKAKSFTLYFTNNIELRIVGMHDLFVKESKKYVTIKESNVDTFIGKHFYNVIDKRYEELISVSNNNELIDFYSIYTKHTFNSIANSMLTLPDDVEYLVNFYEFNEELSTDLKTLNKDIEKYGLIKLEEINKHISDKPISEEHYDCFNSKYLRIIVGKGIYSWQEIIEDYNKNN